MKDQVEIVRRQNYYTLAELGEMFNFPPDQLRMYVNELDIPFKGTRPVKVHRSYVPMVKEVIRLSKLRKHQIIGQFVSCVNSHKALIWKVTKSKITTKKRKAFSFQL